MASFFDLPPEIRMMIYNCLVEYSCKSHGRISSDMKSHSVWSSNPCEFHLDGVCVIGCSSSSLHHAPVGALLSFMKTNSLIRCEAEATLVEGADLTIKAWFPEDVETNHLSFVVIIRRFLALSNPQLSSQIRTLRLDISGSAVLEFGISSSACCAKLMTSLDRICPSLKKLYLYVDVGLQSEEDKWVTCVRKRTLAAVEGLAAGSKKIRLWFGCASSLHPSMWSTPPEIPSKQDEQAFEERLDELRNAYAGTRKKQRDRPVNRPSHYDACYDGLYLLATRDLRSLTMEDSE